MHILYLKTDLSNKPLIAGGSVTHTVGVIKALLTLGHTVSVASTAELSQLKQLPLTDYCLLKMPQWLSFLRWKVNCFLSTFVFLVAVRKLYKQKRPLFIYQRYSPFNLTGALLRYTTGTPLILEYNGSEVWTARFWVTKYEKKVRMLWLMDYFEKLALKTASKIVVVSQAIADELIQQKIAPCKIIVAPNGVDCDLFDPSRLENIRNSLRISLQCQEKFVFGFSGTFSSWHGVEVLALLVKELTEKYSSVHFVFIGDGPLLPWLKNEIERCLFSQPHVTFTGLLNPEEARHYLSTCDAFLCPTQPNADGTRFFGSPTKLFEYLSLGKPVIASDLEQLREVVFPALSIDDLQLVIPIEEQVGVLVNPHNKQDFVEASHLVVNMPLSDRKIIGINGRCRALSFHTWTHHVQKFLTEID